MPSAYGVHLDARYPFGIRGRFAFFGGQANCLSLTAEYRGAHHGIMGRGFSEIRPGCVSEQLLLEG